MMASQVGSMSLTALPDPSASNSPHRSPPKNSAPAASDDILSYLDDDSLTSAQIAMQLPRFEVGMTDKTIPTSEKKRWEQQARKKQQIMQQQLLTGGPDGVGGGTVHDMIAMMENDAASALDLLSTEDLNHDGVRTPEQKPSPGTIFNSSSTGKKKKRKKKRSPAGAEGELVRGPVVVKSAGLRGRDSQQQQLDDASSPLRGKMRRGNKINGRNTMMASQQQKQQIYKFLMQQQQPDDPGLTNAAQVKKGWDPNYVRPWRDNQNSKPKRKKSREYEEPPPAVFHPSKAHGVYKSTAGTEMSMLGGGADYAYDEEPEPEQVRSARACLGEPSLVTSPY